jgi:hypothetical protein
MGWHFNDLTRAARAPLAALRPGGYVYEADASQHVVYAGCSPDGAADGHVHELSWHAERGWRHTDLTSVTGAPPIVAGSTPTGYDFSAQPNTLYGSQHVNYVGTDGHVHEMWSAPDSPGWQHHDLTDATGGRPAINAAVGYSYNSRQRVFYEGSDAHVGLLTWDRNEGWTHRDLTAETGAPLATASPSAYVFERDGTEHVLYLGIDAHVHELWSTGTGWNHHDLTLATQGPLCSDQPAGCALKDEQTQYVAYRGIDGLVHALVWSDGAWRSDDVNIPISIASAASGPVAAYAFNWERSVHVMFNATSGAVWEFWREGKDWHATDVTTRVAAPAALTAPTGYAFEWEPTQHVVYVDESHHIIELWWSP